MFPNRPSSFKIQSTEDVHRLNGHPGEQNKRRRFIINWNPDPGSSSVRVKICCESRLTFEEGKSKKSVIDTYN